MTEARERGLVESSRASAEPIASPEIQKWFAPFSDFVIYNLLEVQQIKFKIDQIDSYEFQASDTKSNRIKFDIEADNKEFNEKKFVNGATDSFWQPQTENSQFSPDMTSIRSNIR